ncbi:MAG: isoaspartyl peptidase/L-asparaginase family protein [Nitrososphaerales archaeon]
MKAKDFGIVVHGGAGSFTPGPDVPIRRKILAKSAEAGYRELRRGASSLDAVEQAIIVLEDSRVFNAGSGSSLTLEGKATADAAIMSGDLKCGSVGSTSVSKNPISLARAVMERSDHVFMVGDDALAKFCKAIGFNQAKMKPSPKRLEQYKTNLALMKRGKVKAWPKNYKLLRSYLSSNTASETSDTVGAVAIDSDGKVAAGVSTGGRWLKLPGRVGDSAVVGAGIYADEYSGAASATGAGEEIIRVALCKMVCDFMKSGMDAQMACEASIDILTNRIGVGIAGVIAVDRMGRFGASRNTEMLQRSFRFSSMKKTHVAVLPQDKDPKRRENRVDTRLKF